MKKYFKVEVKYSKPDEEGGDFIDVTEVYVFEAVNYTDAETTATEKFKEIVPENGQFLISKIEKIKLNLIVRSSGLVEGNEDKWFLVKANYLDDNGKKEILVKDIILINTSKITRVIDLVLDSYHVMRDDLNITSIVETNILEVFNK